MKKLLTALLLTLAYVGAYAQNWVLVDESTSGSLRVLVDSDSWKVTEEEGTTYIFAKFRYVEKGVVGDVVIYLTGLTSCKNRNGVLYHRVFREGRWSTANQYWWSKQGGKLYDSIGGALCDILEVRMKEVNQEKKPAANKDAPRSL